MNVRPRVGVVGAGYWGMNLVRVAAELGVLAAVCDSDPDHLARVRSLYPRVPLAIQFRDLLGSRLHVDALVLAVPAALHAQYALAAIAAGKDVFVEKPLALRSTDAEAILQAAEAAGRKVFVGHLLYYHPGIQALFSRLERGEIGNIVHVRSRRLSWGKLRELENVWWSFAPHDVAIMLGLMDYDVPTSVRASMTAHVREDAADFAYADYRFTRGGTAHIEVGWLDVEKSSRLDVFGTSGVLTFSDSREGASLALTPAGVRQELGKPTLWRCAAQQIEFPPGEPLKAELSAFIDWLQLGTKPPTDGVQGGRVVELLELTQRAADGSPQSYRAIA